MYTVYKVYGAWGKITGLIWALVQELNLNELESGNP